MGKVKYNDSFRFANHCHIYSENYGEWITKQGLPSKTDIRSDGKWVGVPFLKQNSDQCMIALLDIDDHDATFGWDNTSKCAMSLLEVAYDRGLTPHPFKSRGGNGIHLWFVWEKPQHAPSVRSLLKRILTDGGFSVGAKGVEFGEVEIFPKQDRISANDNGNCACLPQTPLDEWNLDEMPTDNFEWVYSNDVDVVEIEESDTDNCMIVSDQLTIEQIDELLSVIPNADDNDYDSWWTVIMAVNSAGGTLEQAEEWSRKSSKYVEDYLEPKWNSIKNNKDSMVTARTLYKLASDNGWTGFDVDVEVFPSVEVVVDYMRVTGKGRYAGYVVTNYEQLTRLLRDDPEFPYVIAWDEFLQDRIIVNKSTGTLKRFEDHHYTDIQIWCDKHKWEYVKTQMLREIVNHVAKSNTTNIAKDWANNLEWDGIDRYDDYLKAMGAEINEYYQAVVRYQWTSHGARILHAGYQADAIIVFISEKQGKGKTQMIKVLKPNLHGFDTYQDIHIDKLLDEAKGARALRGCLIANMDEMRNHTRRENAEIKACLSRQKESYVPKYRETREEFGRSCLIYATNNHVEFLDDETGNRRYHPINVGHVDMEWLESNVEQLWAQGINDFKVNGQAWERALELAPDYHALHNISDVWEKPVRDYLSSMVDDKINCSEILTNAIGMATEKHNRLSQVRVSKIMKGLGWTHKTYRDDDGCVVKGYVKS